MTIFPFTSRPGDALRAEQQRFIREQREALLDAAHAMAVQLNTTGHALADTGAQMLERLRSDQTPTDHHLHVARDAVSEAFKAVTAYRDAINEVEAAGGER